MNLQTNLPVFVSISEASITTGMTKSDRVSRYRVKKEIKVLEDEIGNQVGSNEDQGILEPFSSRN